MNLTERCLAAKASSGIEDVGAAMAGKPAHKPPMPPAMIATDPDDPGDGGIPEPVPSSGFVVELPETLPAGLAESFKLLNKMQATHDAATTRGTKADQIETLKRLRMIKAHCFQLQQIPTVVMTGNQQAEIMAARTDAWEHREQRLRVLSKNPNVANLISAHRKAR